MPAQLGGISFHPGAGLGVQVNPKPLTSPHPTNSISCCICDMLGAACLGVLKCALSQIGNASFSEATAY